MMYSVFHVISIPAVQNGSSCGLYEKCEKTICKDCVTLDGDLHPIWPGV
jgi:hypothetical protein